jgi:hypothetical protein
MNSALRFQDDELSRGAAVSRNCLSEEDEALAALSLPSAAGRAAADADSTSQPAFPCHGPVLVVSAGGPVTDEFVKSLRLPDVAFVDPAVPPRIFAKACASSKSHSLLILGTLRASERRFEAQFPGSRVRFLGTMPCPPQVLPLEPGNLVTGHVAALLERAALDGLQVSCFLAPREAVLDREAAAGLLHVLEASPQLASLVKRPVLGAGAAAGDAAAAAELPAWIARAMRLDEGLGRRREPEGMFM